ncbi:hypothetical protein B0O80DRAFT_441149 [Mortierella sp. GBAus27b]|nr:hypothetical protein B0O80DRAFT_441149 [Mortierella sp. GBAus27b]
MSTLYTSLSHILSILLFATILPIIHAQSFTPTGRDSPISATIDGQGMFILGGGTAGGEPTSQTFKIDLTESWNASAPRYDKLPDGPVSSGMPSAMSADGQTWASVVNDTLYAYNVPTSTWSSIIVDNNFIASPTGLTAATDPDTGFIYIPNGYGQRGNRTMLRLNIKTKSFDTVPMHPDLQASNNHALTWSAASKVMVLFGGGFGQGLYLYSPTQGWSKPVTKGDTPRSRRAGCLVSFDGGKKIVLAGGYSGDTSASLGDIYILDMATLTWKVGPSIATEYSRSGSACGVSNNQLIMWSGTFDDIRSSLLATNTTLVFNLTTNTWTSSYTALPKPKSTTSATTLNQTSTGMTDVTNDSDGNGPRLVIILGSVIGALAFSLVLI